MLEIRLIVNRLVSSFGPHQTFSKFHHQSPIHQNTPVVEHNCHRGGFRQRLCGSDSGKFLGAEKNYE